MTTGKWKPMQEWWPTEAPRELEEMRRRFETDIARPVMRSIWQHLPDEAKGMTVPIDVFDKGESVIVKVEVPGMRLEDIDVSVTEDTLTVKGARKPDAGVDENDYYYNEIPAGNFTRRINLPFSVDAKDINAVYTDGILRITLQRAEGKKPKKIKVMVQKAAL